MLIEIFKTGTHTDSSGNTRTWTEEDLDKIVQKYNPAEHEAPVVVGHPKDNAPAYGWVEGLVRKGGILYAKLKDLAPEFVEWVKKGLYKKRSISLYPDMTLRHVGFLGAMPPAVKGLADVQFSGSDAVTIEFVDYRVNIIGGIFQRLREWLIEKFGADTADKIVSLYDIDYIKTEPSQLVGTGTFAEGDREKAKKAQESRAKRYGIAIKEGGNVTKPSEYESIADEDFADPVNYRYPIDEEHIRAALSYWGMPKNREQYSSEEVKIITKRMLNAAKRYGIEIDESKWKFSEKEEDMNRINELEAKLKETEDKLASFAEKEAEITKLKNELAEERAKQRKAEFNAFCEGLMREGRLTPAMKPVVMDFMEILHGAGEYEFSEGNGKVKAQPVERFKTFLSGLPKQVEFGEMATKDKAEEGKPKTKDFRDMTGWELIEMFKTDPQGFKELAEKI